MNSAGPVAARGRLCPGAVAVALGVLLSASFAVEAARAGNAIGEHKGRLDPPVVVWCIDHPGFFKVAARAYGIDVGTAVTHEITRNKQKITLLKWAELSDKRSRQEFETTCETAFAAFSRSSLDVALDGVRRGVIGPLALHEISNAVDHGTGLSTDAEVGVGGIVLGFVLTGLLGVSLTHNQRNRQDAASLSALVTAFTTDLDAYLLAQDDPAAITRVKIAATRLRNEAKLWRHQQEDSADRAIASLDALISAPPCIGDPGKLNGNEDAFRDELISKASAVRANVARLAERVARRRRFEGPNSE